MLKLVITRPAYEMTTKYLYAWNEKVVQKALSKKVEVFDLPGKRATKINLTNTLSNFQPDLVFLNGHGASDLITGHKNEILIKSGINEGLLKNKHIHALSCETGKILAPSAISAGAKSYIGYDESFVFIATKGKENNPLEDERTAYFLDPAILVSLSLINGDTPKKASENSKNAMRKTVRSLASSGKKDAFLIRYLLWNLKHQVCLT